MGNIENGLGEEGASHRGAVVRAPPATVADGHEAIELQPDQGANETLVVRAQGAEFLPQGREQMVLKDRGERSGQTMQ
jgi:hypothetical protein